MSSIRFEIPLTSDVWMINGVENLHTLINDLDGCKSRLDNDRLKVELTDLRRFIKNLTRRIEAKQDEIIFVKKMDEKGRKKFVRKDFVLIQYGKAKKGRNILKEKIYSDTGKRLREIFSNIRDGNKTCIICGRGFKSSVDKLKQAVHPFTTKIKSLSGVRTLKDNYDNLCPLCYLVGTLEWLDEGIIYRCSLGSGERKYSVIFLPFELDLKKLHEIKKECRKILTRKDSFVSNLMKIVQSKDGEEREVGYEGEYTTMLKFLERFVRDVMGEHSTKKYEDIDELFGYVERRVCKSWFTMKIPSGNVKNIRLGKVDIGDEIVNLLIKMEREDISIYDTIIDKISVHDKNKNKIDTKKTPEVKELMAKTIIHNDFRTFSRFFLPRKNPVVYYGDFKNLDKLIKFWGLVPMKIEENLDVIKDAAENLAKLLKNHLSIIYEMDKARSKEDFIRVFEQACKRLLGLKEEERKSVYPQALENFADLILNSSNSEWKTIRDVLIIYTSIFISKSEYKSSVGGRNEERKPRKRN